MSPPTPVSTLNIPRDPDRFNGQQSRLPTARMAGDLHAQARILPGTRCGRKLQGRSGGPKQNAAMAYFTFLRGPVGLRDDASAEPFGRLSAVRAPVTSRTIFSHGAQPGSVARRVSTLSMIVMIFAWLVLAEIFDEARVDTYGAGANT